MMGSIHQIREPRTEREASASLVESCEAREERRRRAIAAAEMRSRYGYQYSPEPERHWLVAALLIVALISAALVGFLGQSWGWFF